MEAEPSPKSRSRLFNASNLLAIMAMGIGSIGYGYSANVIAPVLVYPSFNDYYSLQTRSNGNAILACMTSMYYVGGTIAAFSIGFVAERYGRKWAIAASAIITLISGALLAGSVNAAMFIVFRFFSGAGGNLLSATIPIWMAEVVPAKNRGLLVDMHGAMYVFGYMAAAWVGYGFYYLDSPNAWRAPFAVQCIAPLILLAGIYWLPESPRWLLMKDRHEEAREILHRLHEPHEAEKEFVQIDAQMRIDKTLDTSYWIMLKKPSYRKRLLLSIACTGFNQFSGILVITNYSPLIYKNLGYNTPMQLLYNSGWQTLSLGCSIIGLFIIDHVTRPHMLQMGIAGCMICLAIEAALVAEFVDSTNQPALKAAVAMIFLYNFFFQGLLNGTQWAYVSELWPSHMRPKGLAMGLVAILATNICFVQAAPTAFANIGWRYYLVFIIPSFIWIIVIQFTFPDTKGMPLEDVARLFGDTDELARIETTNKAMDEELEAHRMKDDADIEHHENAEEKSSAEV